MTPDEFRKARAELARAAQLSSIRDSHDPTLTIAIDVIDELLRQSDVYQAAVPAESAVEATLIAYHRKWGQPWPPDPELFGEIGAAEIEAIRETMCAALTAAGIHVAEAAAPTGTEWFWEIVDRNGLGDVPSDERGALSRLVRLAEAGNAEAVAAETERCAKLVEWFGGAPEIAAAIRARQLVEWFGGAPAIRASQPKQRPISEMDMD